jgi:hypothetical protein
MTPRIIYYYQTFCGLTDILSLSNPSETVTHIHLGSIHFGIKQIESQYIHLNDNSPYDSSFDTVWKELELCVKKGVKVVLMIGGAGGAYGTLFSNYKVYYKLLKRLIISKKNIISGVDLDIEEPMTLNECQMLICNLKSDFGMDFSISLAPVQSSLEYDQPGMSGFVYKDLLNSAVGKHIDYFCGQFYSDYSLNSLKSVIKNGYPPSKIVMGMVTGQDFDDNCLELTNIIEFCCENNLEFGGVFNWEYYNSPPDGEKNPVNWAIRMNSIISNTIDEFNQKEENKKNESIQFYNYQNILVLKEYLRIVNCNIL